MAGSGLRPLPIIPNCCLQMESEPCLSFGVADAPRRPAKDLRLGQPLPNQLPNPKKAHHKTRNFSFKQEQDLSGPCPFYKQVRIR